tara:strand:- start:1230 stop:2069 length:840 start_codon:yes stop_codon:yes gene_type:complete
MNDRPRFSGGRCIPDVDTLNHLSNILQQISLKNCVVFENLEYCDKYRTWIESSDFNKVTGLDQFPYQQFTLGVTEAIDKFYMRHRNRTIKVLPGEYSYHTKADYAIELEALTSDDALIISLPFSSTGDQHIYEELLSTASKLNVPVFVDCAWFGTCYDIDFDLSYPCIEEAAFSLSKSFPVAYLRIGCRFTKAIDGLTLYDDANYISLVGQWIGTQFLDRYSSDYIPDKYYEAQQRLCQELQVTPSKCVQLALGGRDWDYLKRHDYNRLCLSDEIIGWK